MQSSLRTLAVTLVLAALTNAASAQAQQDQTQSFELQQRVNPAIQWVNPNPTPLPPPAPKMGFQGQMIAGVGMKVLYVNPGTPAQQAGLEPGDIVVRINDMSITCQTTYDQAMRNAAQYYGGNLKLLVKNIRFDWGQNVPQYVTTFARLPSAGFPIGVPAVAASPQ